MILKGDEISARLDGTSSHHVPNDPLRIIPTPELVKLRNSGSTSVDLRLGRWFLLLRHDRTEILDVLDEESHGENQHLARAIFVPFGNKFVLHPRTFVLGATLEWIRLPSDLGGYITGKSSWGRRGLVIETAAGVHPGFTGCLTLEISNLGSVPIAIRPGLNICQVALHTSMGGEAAARGSFLGLRRPEIGHIKLDEVAKRLAKPV